MMMTPTDLDGPALSPLSGEEPRRLVILLHGYGSNGADMISLAPRWQRALPDALFIAPNAPERCPGVPGGYQWWGLGSFDPVSLAAGVSRAAPVLNGFIDRQLARHGLSNGDVMLVGFSQGTMIALQAGLRREPPVAGIIGYSGMLAAPVPPSGGRPPILLIHGDQDSTVPIAALQQARVALERAGVKVSAHALTRLAHGVDERGLKLGEEFARRVFRLSSAS
jgi:phospholipase/carboxylesterase